MAENKNTAVSDRASVITIGGQEYELLLTTKATKEIGKKYEKDYSGTDSCTLCKCSLRSDLDFC